MEQEEEDSDTDDYSFLSSDNESLSDLSGEDSDSDDAPPFSPLSSDNESFSSLSEEELEQDNSDEPTATQQPMVTDKPLTTTYSIVGDNIDKSIRPRYMRVNSGNQQVHK